MIRPPLKQLKCSLLIAGLLISSRSYASCLEDPLNGYHGKVSLISTDSVYCACSSFKAIYQLFARKKEGACVVTFKTLPPEGTGITKKAVATGRLCSCEPNKEFQVLLTQGCNDVRSPPRPEGTLTDRFDALVSCFYQDRTTCKADGLDTINFSIREL